METTHKIHLEDSRKMDNIKSESIDLMITSPPYPMIEMWDSVFSSLNKEIADELEEGNGRKAFELMHEELNKVWEEVIRVLKPGGIACINIGDATRKVDGEFHLYPNHAKVTDFFQDKGLSPLPEILWRKQTNKANKFMGSGMIPPNAYVTLEHEFMLFFRKGGRRSFEPKSEKRYQSAYFWEERNKWFSDLWTDIKGIHQNLNHNELRKRSAAFPLEIPYRIINMYSVQKDKVLDPFWGTGTTSLAAMASGRNSVGYEIEEDFIDVFHKRTEKIKEITKSINNKRLKEHLNFQKKRKKENKKLSYEAENYNFKVTTKQEKNILFFDVEEIEKVNNSYKVTHKKSNFKGNDISYFTDNDN